MPLLEKKFSGRVILRHGYENWPPRLWYLTALNFWVFFSEVKVFATDIQTNSELKKWAEMLLKITLVFILWPIGLNIDESSKLVDNWLIRRSGLLNKVEENNELYSMWRMYAHPSKTWLHGIEIFTVNGKWIFNT